MNQALQPSATTEEQGRLPAPPSRWPLSRQRFDALAAAWRSVGAWLSLWNDDGDSLACDERAQRLWTTLWKNGGAFRAGLAEFARAAARDANAADAADRLHGAVGGPWRPNIALIAVPIRYRSRATGVIVAAVATSDRPGENIARLCGQCRLDESAVLRLAAQAGLLDEAMVAKLSGLLAQAVDQARVNEVAEDEIEVLTQNLQNTYEELNLVYRISGQMGLPKNPSTLLAKIGHDVLEVSRARTMAFVLSENAANGPATEQLAGSLDDRVIQIGEAAPHLADLDRLAEALHIDAAATAPFHLHNNAPKRPELQWTQPWLKHLVALPLKQGKNLLGVMLAMNCVDDGDFTSVDVQLLRAVADRVAAFLENQSLYDDLADLLMALLHAMVNSVDAKDPYTYGHSERVAIFSRSLAQAAKLPQAECDRVYLAGLLHDVGKIGVPDAILCKPGKLTTEEFDTLKKHPEIGVRILSPVKQIRDLLPGVLNHHERMDGGGYPQGLAGESIPRLGRIICLADCFDAMTSNRTYRAAMPLSVAIAEIRRCSGTQFDPALSELFLQLDLEALMRRDRPASLRPPSMAQLGALSRRV